MCNKEEQSTETSQWAEYVTTAKAHGCVFIELIECEIPTQVLDALSIDIVNTYRVVPTSERDGVLVVATYELDLTKRLSICDALRYILCREVELALSPKCQIEEVIKKHYTNSLVNPKPIEIQPPPCDKCQAYCCKGEGMGHEYAVILESDEVERFKDIAVNHGTETDVEMVIPYGDDRNCILLKDDKCSRYDDRPSRCKAYNCRYFLNYYDIGKPAMEIAQHPDLWDILKADEPIPLEAEIHCKRLTQAEVESLVANKQL